MGWGGYVGGASGLALVILAIVGLGRYLLSDKSVATSQRAEIRELRADIVHLKEQMARLEVLYDEQRTLKHAANNSLAKATLTLDLVRGLALKCTCGALDPLGDILTDPSRIESGG